MSFEPGGRSDKYGNEYENRYFAKLLLRLIREDIAAVIVEPLGPNSNSVEFVTEQKDNTTKYYQCKASNTTHKSWSISDLKKYDVFSRAKRIILNNENSYYYFISPLQYGELDELCIRARTNSSPEDFVAYQLTNNKIRATFNDCAIAFGFDKSDPADLKQLVFVLAHCYFEQYFSGTEAEQDLNERIGMLFAGKASSIRALLEHYANDTGKYGIKITAKDIVDYLEERDIHIRNYGRDERILNRISVMNHTHWDKYHAIFDNLVHRTATDNIIDNIKAGSSVILHGKAGSGKSGCLQELINYLDDNHILYLALKLDKHIPSSSADTYGKQLGFPESPVHCLATMAAGKTCVLILDQLDALRWTSNHSGDALSVCKELIFQAEAINTYSGGKISIVFASRTFDLENDKGLKNLFYEREIPSDLGWSKVNVDFFTNEDVVQIIGPIYNSFSPRLKKLLLTPSSLYVWSKLGDAERKNNISSVFELMSIWWQQIQGQCDIANIPVADAIACKNKIVAAMEKRAVFALPISLFADSQRVIDSFVSNGILIHNTNTKSISFTHQSFLDYFIISDTMERIYTGYDLKDLIGRLDEQTPIVRYRLLSVFQNLIDSNQTIFVEQSLSLLKSDSVRYYFKCAVFEIIGQHEAPEAEIFTLVDLYLKKPEWSDYITQVVFYGHPSYVMHLISLQHGWFSDTTLSLLKSISRKEPDFVTRILSPFALQNEEQDRQIFWTLCHDANDDSEGMFQLRRGLLEKQPALFQNFWGFSELIKKKSGRAVDLFNILLENWKVKIGGHIYFAEKNELLLYAKSNYQLLVNGLFQKICDLTCDYLPQWPYCGIDSEFRDWTRHNYNESFIRKIIEIVKFAFEEYSISNPNGLMKMVVHTPYPLSAVGHELIMHALCNLPIEYGNDVIRWLLVDFNEKVFVFSADEADYLCYTKQILQKFSPYCNMELFTQLERVVCAWRESSEKMVRTYKYRLEENSTHQHEPVYYAYWGHFQKALLPSMCYQRLSAYSKELLGVVNRNSWIHLPHFYSGFTVSSAKFVGSPIDGYVERLSNKTWLQIISTSQNKMNNHWKGRDDGSSYIEANHRTFASALGRQAKRQPSRFAMLSLDFPEDCYESYVSNVLHALSENGPGQDVGVDLISKVIRRYGYSTNLNIAIALSRVIESYAHAEWQDDIFELIKWIAINHPHPDKDEYGVTSSSDPEHNSVRSLLDNSINCVRGCALHAIAALLWEKRDLGDYFKETVSVACLDKNDAVRFAVMSCVMPYYNIDREFSFDTFKTLVSCDLRVVAAPGCWEIMSREYENHANFIRKKVIEACASEIEDLAEDASGLLCALAIFHDDQCAFDSIISGGFNSKQQAKICMQAVYSFNVDEYHERSLKILLHLIDNVSEELFGFNRLFFDRCISIHRDTDFLIHLMGSQYSVRLLHSFLDCLYESDEDICEYATVLAAIGDSLSQAPSQWNTRLAIDDFVKCVVRLFDRGQNNPQIKTLCLDLWDKLFMSNLQDIKPLSDMIDNFE